MTQQTINLYQYGYKEAKTYITAALFVVGNILLPQLAHTVHMGGMIWLPIYFFTLIGAYKYGWHVGLLTAVASPVINHLLFGMPPVAMQPAILTKSVLLALAGGYAAKRYQTVSIATLASVVLFYQLVGSVAEWGYTGSMAAALQDTRIGLPGMALQIVGGYLVIRYLLRK